MKPVWNRRNGLLTAATVVMVVVAGGIPFLFLRTPQAPEQGSGIGGGGESAATAAGVVAGAEDAAGLAAERRAKATRVMDVTGLPTFAGLEPRRITVDFNNLELETAVQEFAAQTGVLTDKMFERPLPAGIPIITRPAKPAPVVPADHRVTMHMQEGTLLQGVLEMVQEGADIRQLNAKGVRLSESRDHEVGTGRLCIAGPFAVVLGKVTTGATKGGAMLGPNEARMPMMVYADPTMLMLEARMPPAFEELVDEKGQSPVATWVTGTTPVAASVRESIAYASAEVKLTWAGLPGSRLRMKGTVNVTIQRETETVMSEGVAGWPVEQKAGDLAVVFRDFQTMGGFRSSAVSYETYELHLAFRRGKIDVEQWQKMADVLPRKAPQVLDARGRALSCDVGMKSLSEDPDVVEVRYHVSAGTQHLVPDHVKLEVLQGVRQVGVPFEYEDVRVETGG